jgi:hypothetical protein
MNCPKCGKEMKKDKIKPVWVTYPDQYCAWCNIEWDEGDLV